MPDPQKRNVVVVVREDSDGLELLRRLPDQLPMEWVNVFVLVHDDGRKAHPLAEDGEGPSSSSGGGGKVYRQALKMLPGACPKEMVLLLTDEKSVDAMLKQIAAETVVVQGAMAGGVKGVVEGGWVGGAVIVEQGGDGAESEVKGWKTKRAAVKGLEDLEKEWKDRVI